LLDESGELGKKKISYRTFNLPAAVSHSEPSNETEGAEDGKKV